MGASGMIPIYTALFTVIFPNRGTDAGLGFISWASCVEYFEVAQICAPSGRELICVKRDKVGRRTTHAALKGTIEARAPLYAFHALKGTSEKLCKFFGHPGVWFEQ